jgi:hypothetical protein
MRALPAEALIDAQVKTELNFTSDLLEMLQLFMPWTPTTNTTFLPVKPLTSFQSGNIADVPILIGVFYLFYSLLEAFGYVDGPAGTVLNESNLFLYTPFTDPVSVVSSQTGSSGGCAQSI